MAGIGIMGLQIARALCETGHEVTALELDHNRAEAMRSELSGTVVEGDCCDPQVLERAGLEGQDAFVALTGRDEDNLVSSLLAKDNFHVGRVVARVNDPRNSWLFGKDWGVDLAMSAPSILLSLVQEATSASPTVNLLDLVTAGVRVVEASVGLSSPLVGLPVGEIQMPDGVIIATVIRSGTPMCADAELVIARGDQLLVVAERAAEGSLDMIFG